MCSHPAVGFWFGDPQNLPKLSHFTRCNSEEKGPAVTTADGGSNPAPYITGPRALSL